MYDSQCMCMIQLNIGTNTQDSTATTPKPISSKTTIIIGCVVVFAALALLLLIATFLARRHNARRLKLANLENITTLVELRNQSEDTLAPTLPQPARLRRE